MVTSIVKVAPYASVTRMDAVPVAVPAVTVKVLPLPETVATDVLLLVTVYGPLPPKMVKDWDWRGAKVRVVPMDVARSATLTVTVMVMAVWLRLES